MGHTRALPTFASIDVEHLTFGKFVTCENGPVPFGRDYEVTRMSAGLARWKFDAMRPSGLAQNEAWAAEKVDPAFGARGFLLVKQIANPDDVSETGVVLARLRFRSEGGEGVVGRRYLQCKSWLVRPQDWSRYASSILAAAGSELVAIPDEVTKPDDKATEDARKNDRLISLSLSVPAAKEQFSGPVRQILKHVLDQAKLEKPVQLALGNESFNDEIEFLNGIGLALDWLGEFSDLLRGFVAGYVGTTEDVFLRWSPSRTVAPLAPAPSPIALDEQRTTLRISSRRSLSDQDLQHLAHARADRRDFMNTLVPSSSPNELDRFIRRAKASADLRGERQASVGRDRSSGYAEFLKEYNRSPGSQTASDLISRFQEDFAKRLIVARNPNDGHRNDLMLACVQPVALDDVNMALPLLDWALGLAKRVRSEGAPSCLDQLSTNLTSLFAQVTVLCPAELDELKELDHLIEWLSGPKPFAVEKLLRLSGTLNKFIEHHVSPTTEEISEIGVGLRRRCRAAYCRFEEYQSRYSPEPVPGEIVEKLYMLSDAYDRVQSVLPVRVIAPGRPDDLGPKSENVARSH